MAFTKHLNYRALSKAALMVVMGFIATNASALESDSKQNIELEADVVDVDQSNGIAIYKGNVKLKQGSIRITADKIRVTAANGQLEKAVIEGNKQVASFQQTLESGQVMLGQAKHIEVLQSQELVLFKGDAVLDDGFNKISGPLIRYNAKQQKIVADKAGKEDGRVKMIFLPSPKK